MWGQQAAGQWGAPADFGGMGMGMGMGKGKGKGKGKGPMKVKIPGPTPEENKAQKDAAFLTFATNIVPTIAAVVDEHDGFCSIGVLGNDQRIKDALATIPDGHKRSVSAVVSKFPDFISTFDGGRVATAKGYENGLVNQDGTINAKPKPKKRERPAAEETGEVAEEGAAPPAMKKKRNNKKSAAAGGELGDVTMTGEPREPGAPKPIKPMRDLESFANDKQALNYLQQRLAIITERGTEEQVQEVNDLLSELQNKIIASGGTTEPTAKNKKPKKAKGEPGAEKRPAQEPVEDVSAGMSQPDLIEAVVQIVRGFEEKGVQAFASNVCNCDEARAIKNALAEQGCKKMALIFRKFPETFEMTPQQGPGVVVSIKPGYKAGMDQEAVEIDNPKLKAYLERKAEWAAKKEEAKAEAAAAGTTTEVKVEAAA